MRLKLKLAKSSKNSKPPPKTIEVDKEGKGSDLAGVIATSIGCNANELRVICGGKVLDKGKKVVEQGVKPGVAVMAVRVDPEGKEMKVLEEQREILDGLRSDAELLGDDDGDRHGLNVAGNSFMSLLFSIL